MSCFHKQSSNTEMHMVLELSGKIFGQMVGKSCIAGVGTKPPTKDGKLSVDSMST